MEGWREGWREGGRSSYLAPLVREKRGRLGIRGLDPVGEETALVGLKPREGGREGGREGRKDKARL